MTIKLFKELDDQRREEYRECYERYVSQLESIGRTVDLDEKIPEPREILKPNLDPQLLDCDMLEDYVPEKTELLDGVLYFGDPWLSRMFLLLLFHIGLKEAVRFAPKEMWLKALEEWDGEPAEIE